ncbi:hypothetical protein QN277_017972 [Acacia crassicarpa]|uniref:BZIP domain-containing protein n=1 Tax=Acacia crassicarpa TaxID=499986 RepID=A0AAE1JPL2_9FABA|nr:hypothetical protein QN277_017972 [Acacia crassicarpa]
MMDSPSGNYTCLSNSRLQNLGSDQEKLMQIALLEKKKKRKEANRLSARQSRKRKQKYMDDMVTQVVELRRENTELVAGLNTVMQMCQNVESENSILRAQMVELTHTLRSLNHIIDLVNTTTISSSTTTSNAFNFAAQNPMNMFLSPNQPMITACAAMFQC